MTMQMKLKIPVDAHPVVKMVIQKEEVSDADLKVLMRKMGRGPQGIQWLNNEQRISWNKEKQCWIPGPRAYDY